LQKVFANFDTSGKVTAVTFDEELKSSIATLARAVSNGKQLSSNSKNHSYGGYRLPRTRVTVPGEAARVTR
jgi:hypothetical protein